MSEELRKLCARGNAGHRRHVTAANIPILKSQVICTALAIDLMMDRQQLMATPGDSSRIASSGIAGLDDILCGGFLRDRLFLIEGVPGSGKTTLALQFLMAGAARNEPVMYITLSETEEELRASAASHGWDLAGIAIRDMSSDADFDPEEQNTMFHPSEVELAATTRKIMDIIVESKPSAVVFDSLSELRLLAGSALRFRRQVLAFKRFLASRSCTVLLLDDKTSGDPDLQMQSLAHGVVLLEQLNPEYGSERRRLRVVKYRGVKFRGGYHDYAIRTGGIEVYTRLVAAEHRGVAHKDRLCSGIPEMDSLLGGGIEEGTSTLIVGAAGTGKSTLAMQFATSGAERGVQTAAFLFDEAPHTLTTRCDALGLNVSAALQSGRLTLQQVDPAELTPGELTHAIRFAVEQRGVKIVVIDSLNGYLNAMPEEHFLVVQLHEVLMYLGQQGVATILIGAHSGLIGSSMRAPIDASYLADAVILLRYFELPGEVCQAISVVKKRGGHHERTIRELRLGPGGIQIGQPLREFRGVLTGVPVFEGEPAPANLERSK
jgi:circadian clock protein KaiC